MFTCESEISSGQCPDRFGRILLSNGTLQNVMKPARYFGTDSRFESCAIGKVAVESVRSNAQRRCDTAKRHALDSMIFHLLERSRQDRLPVGFRWIRHEEHCTS